MNGESRCSYCGKYVYEDIVRCPACGNYTDGLGPLAKGGDPEVDGPEGERRLPRLYVAAGWLVILGLLLPVLMAIYYKFKR